jgi:hypothetical protein
LAKFYSNENVPLPPIEHLRKLGHDVLTSYEAGNANLGISDHDVLRFAADQGRAVLTLNRKDFIALHGAVGEDHAGVLVCTADANFLDQAIRIDRAIPETGDLAGILVRVNRQPR